MPLCHIFNKKYPTHAGRVSYFASLIEVNFTRLREEGSILLAPDENLVVIQILIYGNHFKQKYLPNLPFKKYRR